MRAAMIEPFTVSLAIGTFAASLTSGDAMAQRAQLSQAERKHLFDHDLKSEGAALRKVKAYEPDANP